MTPQEFSEFIASDQMTDEHWIMFIQFFHSLTDVQVEYLSTLDQDVYPNELIEADVERLDKPFPSFYSNTYGIPIEDEWIDSSAEPRE